MSSPNPSGPVTFGKYQLVQRLGRGGMAEVWRAKIIGPAGFQRTLVVKRILPHLVEDPHFVRMFVDEARLSARLNHPNIVQVFELGDVNGEYFLAMEYVRGHDLISVVRAFLPRGGAPPVGLGALAMRDVCRALGYAHALTDEGGNPLRLIHRDVTPSNIMVSFDGVVKLLDFGIAKALNEANDSKTQTGTLKGKFGYMAPEQVEGLEFDHRADLFSAGVVLHEVLTGRRLFKGTTDLQTIAKVRDAKVPRPSEMNPTVTEELERICLKALAREADDRYGSCEEMAQDLDGVVHELKWGPERLASTLREMFPDDTTTQNADVEILPSEERHVSGFTVGSLKKHRRNRMVAAVVGVGLLAGTAVAVVPRLMSSKPAVHAGVAAAPLPTSNPNPEAPKLSTDVRVMVDSVPQGAQVFVEGDSSGQPRGVTPVALTLPRNDTTQVRVVVKAKGYQPSSIDVLPQTDSQVKLTLLAAPVVGKKVKIKTPTKKSAEAAATTNDHAPDVRKGDVVDPFAH
jgi:serine/threonine protein kinase